MKQLVVAVVLAGCAGSPPPPPVHGDVTGPKDARTPLEQRRDTACDALGPKVTQCAVADAKAELDAGKVSAQQFKQDTAPEIQHKNTEEFLRLCKVQMSSRQVRVLEVCLKEETVCDPLMQCLAHINDGK